MMRNPSAPWGQMLRDQLMISVPLVILVILLVGHQQGASMAIGAGLTTLNIALLSWSWTRLFTKKSVALAGLIIVIKYAFFVGFLFWVIKQSWIQGLWLMGGVVTFVPTSLMLGWRLQKDNGKVS